MRIQITHLPRDSSRFQRDGIDLSHYCIGELYDIAPTVGTYLIVMGVAEPATAILDRRQIDPPPLLDAPPTRRLGYASDTPSPDVAYGALRNDRRATVLLVDDVLDQLDMYEMAIEERYRVLRASRGREAFALANQAMPDIIVLDVMLPDVDGVTLCQQLKAGPATASIPVLLLTAYASPLIEANGLEVGAAAVLAKPCLPQQLMSAIDTALRAAQV